MVSTLMQRGWLRRIYLLVPGTYASLLAALNGENSTTNAGVGAGGAVTQVAANGHSISYSSPGSSSNVYAPQDLAEMSALMLDRYDQAIIDLVASGIPSPTDAQIYAQMLGDLQPAYEATPDFSNLMAGRC
jgi:hypothetical protein